MSEYTEVSPEDIVNAMEQDGYKKFQGNFFEFDDRSFIVAACAMGQAALNLDISSYDVMSVLSRIFVGNKGANEWVARMNDDTRTQVPTIARKLRMKIKNDPLFKVKREVSSVKHSVKRAQ